MSNLTSEQRLQEIPLASLQTAAVDKMNIKDAEVLLWTYKNSIDEASRKAHSFIRHLVFTTTAGACAGVAFLAVFGHLHPEKTDSPEAFGMTFLASVAGALFGSLVFNTLTDRVVMRQKGALERAHRLELGKNLSDTDIAELYVQGMIDQS